MKILSYLLLSALLLTACSGNQQQAYIDATIEVTCQLNEIEDISKEIAVTRTKAIFDKHGFDSEDSVAMNKVTAKYKSVPEVQEGILSGIEDCGSLDFDQEAVAR